MDYIVSIKSPGMFAQAFLENAGNRWDAIRKAWEEIASTLPDGIRIEFDEGLSDIRVMSQMEYELKRPTIPWEMLKRGVVVIPLP